MSEFTNHDPRNVREVEARFYGLTGDILTLISALDLTALVERVWIKRVRRRWLSGPDAVRTDVRITLR
jgi:hypothetical protein